jgi:hypothetical protein
VCRSNAAGSHQHGYAITDQICRKLRQAAGVRLCPAVFDPDVLALDIARQAQALVEGAQTDRICLRRSSRENANHWHRLLTACR